MIAEEDRLLELAGAAADGIAVDWKKAEERSPSDEERATVRQLRILADIARLHSGSGSDDARSSSDPSEVRTLDLSGQPAAPLSRPRQTITSETARRWGHLNLIEKVGEGAYGEVFRAWDTRLDREVALKLLREVEPAKESLAVAIIEEGRLLARIRHPGVVTVYGAERIDGRVGVWMEFVRGRTLHEDLRQRGPLGAKEASLIGLDLCRALAAVHGAGLLHGDIKAGNVMREEGGRIVLMDMGAGRELKGSGHEAEGQITGTPLYIAPEILQGHEATPRSDLYSLGVLLFHLVSCSYPVEARTLRELIEAHALSAKKILRDVRPDLPEGFVKVVERLLAGEPSLRYGSAGETEQALSVALGVEAEPVSRMADMPPRAERSSRVKPRLATWLAGGLAAAAILVVAWLQMSDRAKPLAPASAGSFTVEAALYRKGSLADEQLAEGSRLAPGDRLYLQINGTASMYVYVLNMDDKGKAYLLFPLPGLDIQNPLPPEARQVLPGPIKGRFNAWVVNEPGGRESFLVVASRERLSELEKRLGALELARSDRPVEVSPETIAVLRSVGGLMETEPPNPGASLRPIFDSLRDLQAAGGGGLWVREFHLQNPAP